MKKDTEKKQLATSSQDESVQKHEKIPSPLKELETIAQSDSRSRTFHWSRLLGTLLLVCVIGGGGAFIHYLDTSHNGISARPTSLATQNRSGWCRLPIIGLDTSIGTPSIKDVVAVSTNDVWAVGTLGNRSLVEHWDGVRLAVTSSPHNEGDSEQLMGVAAIATNNVWAVGITITPSPGLSTVHPLIEHWDGHQWRAVPGSAAVSGNGGLLQSIAAVSSDDVWSVGYTAQNGTIVALIEHWDGHKWSIVPVPVSMQKIALTTIAAISKGDIWVAGTSTDAKSVPTVAHWDGSRWSIASNFSLKGNITYPVVLSTSAANNIWLLARKTSGQSWFAHWNGTQWQMVSGPLLKPTEWLTRIVAIAPDDAWAVGGATALGDSEISGQTIMEHWDGKSWRLVSQIQPETGGFSAIAAIDHKIWLFGTAYRGLQQIPDQLTERTC
ncbi:MAG TPA: hypothetical protein VFV38_29965 [Ktedonobacteraceae bacterium]|nr:hypothetical protein [Ktedonobacteraceae bacterium]